MNTKNISYILSTISVFAFMYYYFSLDMIWHCLAPFDLDMTSIITWDDIQFTFASFLIPSLFSFSIAFGGISLIAAPLLDSLKERKDKILESLSKYIRRYSKKRCLFNLGGLLFLILIIVTTSFILDLYPAASIYYIIAGAVFAYCKYGRGDIIFHLMIFIAMLFFCSDVKKRIPHFYNTTVKIESINGDIIETDAQHRLVFLGTKYIVVQEDSTNAKLYPTNGIKNIEWINK